MIVYVEPEKKTELKKWVKLNRITLSRWARFMIDETLKR
jgi:hypothetical protein